MPEITKGKWVGSNFELPNSAFPPNAISEREGLLLLAGGFTAAVCQPACISFTLHDGRTLTYWRDSWEVGDAWEVEDA